MLNICSKVSRRWAVVVSEVLGEYFVNQELREEVMLMQVMKITSIINLKPGTPEYKNINKKGIFCDLFVTIYI